MPVAALPRVVLVLLVGATMTITLSGARSISGIVGPAFLALVLVITLHPIRTWLRGRRVPEWLASTGLLLSIYVVLILVSLMLLVSVGRLATLVPEYTDDINDLWADFAAWLQDQGVGDDQVDAVVNAFDFGSLVGVATDILAGIVGVATDLFFVLTLLLFLAFDTSSTTRVLAALHDRRPDMVEGLRSFAIGTRNYMGVSAGFGLIVAVVDTIALSIMGIPGAFVWGVLAFVTNFIPNIGFVIGVIPPAVLGLLEGGVPLMLGVIAVYCVVNFVIQSVIQPKIVGDRVGLSATITFMSLVFWAWLLGPLGALLAVPLSLLMRGILIEADPSARWALPLVSGKLPKEDPFLAGETSTE